MHDDSSTATDITRNTLGAAGGLPNRPTVPLFSKRSGPPARRRFSIRPALIALVTASVLPALGAFAIVVGQDYRQQQREIERETLLQARALASTVDREFSAADTTLQVIAAAVRGPSADVATFNDRVRASPPLPIVVGYFLIDHEARRLADSRGGRGLSSPAIRAAGLTDVFERRERMLSGVFRDPSTGRPALAVAVPVVRNGDAAVAVAVVAELSIDRLARVLAEAPLPRDWVATIVDRTGTIVARSRDNDRHVGEKGSEFLIARLAREAEGTFEGRLRDGMRTISSHTRSSTSDLVVVVGAPRSALVARLANTLGGLVAFGAAMLGVALWFALRLARVVTRSVEGLIEPALALGRGEIVDLPTTRVKEVHAVGQALAEAARMLAAAKHQAHHDALTGLCNRLLFDEVAFHQFASARRAGRRLALLAIDLDGFKAVNDRHGHAAGDTVLKLAADRIRRTIRASDVVSRRGGDEFTVLLGDVGQVLTRQIGEKLVAALAEPYPGIDTPVSASIGIAIFPESGTTVDELLARADEALYAAKHAGKRRVSGDV